MDRIQGAWCSHSVGGEAVRAYPFCTMRCTVRRLIVYTVLITLISYTGFRLTQPVSIPNSNPAANVGIVISAGVQAGGETREPRMGASEPKVDVASITPIVPTETRVDDLEEQPTSSPPPPQPAQPRAPPPPPTPLLGADDQVVVKAEGNATVETEVNATRIHVGKPGEYVAPKSKLAEDNQLTAELVGRYAEDNIVMVTWANHHYHDFVRNWVRNVRKCGMRNYMVGAMDNELLEKLIDDEVPTFAMQSGLTTKDFGWGTANFHKMGRKKIELIHLFTEMGFDILVSDVDTVWLRNPLPYMAKYPHADVLTSSDHLANTAEGEGLEDPRKAHSAANIGIMLLRHTAKELAKEWVDVLERDDKVWDQNVFNDLYRRGGGPSVKDDKNVVTGYDGKLKVGILPVSMFASGHTYFVQRMHEKVGLEPYVVHATFQYSGTEGKRHRMREALLWEDSPEYYDPPGGLLVFTPDVPKELLDNSQSVEGHFDLVNHQILQVKSALQIAQKLGRVLVMPELYCGFDRWWAPHKGTIPGSDTTLPYLCPMDHVFEVETWMREQPVEEFGPHIDFREYSFFRNPLVPTNVRDSTVTVSLVDECGREECTQAVGKAAPAGQNTIVAARNFTDVQVQTLLTEYKDVKVLNFTSMVGAFSRFEDLEDAKKFSNRIKKYAAIWCCKHRNPGHIWYDMEFDIVPHVDRHNRKWDGGKNKWKLVTGP